MATDTISINIKHFDSGLNNYLDEDYSFQNITSKRAFSYAISKLAMSLQFSDYDLKPCEYRIDITKIE